jgi:predicted metal-dependent hydrolase
LKLAAATHQLAFVFDAGAEPPAPGFPAGVCALPAPAPEAPLHMSAPRRTVTLFVRHPRARRYVVRVIDEHTVRVTLPRWGSTKEAAAFAERERPWIDKQLRRLQDEQARRLVHPGIAHPTLGTIAADGQRLSQRELIERAKSELPSRVDGLARLHHLTVARVSIRNQRWRWGSCSRAGHICLNWRLVTMPDWVRDYVIIHELMHLKRMDHSKRFWKLVAHACPDFQRARRYLREHSAALAPGVMGR